MDFKTCSCCAGGPINTLKARAVLIDTETGVLNSLLSGSLGEIFDSRQLISDQYGAGNNWAQGHMEYGPKYENKILESFSRTGTFWLDTRVGRIMC